nr:basic leucine zipper 23-like [Tanacetum cinerariifolium]
MFSGSNVGDIPSSGSVTSFFDEIFSDVRACTHTHTCNSPGPISSHTHTCYHVHTKIIPPMSNDDKIPADDVAESFEKKGKQHSKGNTDAVKKEFKVKCYWKQNYGGLSLCLLIQERTASIRHDLHVYGCDLDLECIRNQGSILLNEVSGCGAKNGLVITKSSCETKRK